MIQSFRRVTEKATTAAIGSALDLLGLPAVQRLTRERMRHAGLILMFHHVAPPDPNRLSINKGLEVSPETLDRVLISLKAQNYDIVPMDEAPERLAQGSRAKRRFATLTFDDGGCDNLIHAAPILQRHGAPFTVYVTTGFASGETAPWWHVIERAAMAAPSLAITTAKGRRRFDTSDRGKKIRAANALHQILWRSGEITRAQQTAELAAQAGLDPAALTRELYMSWKELGEIAALPGCSIGAHTATHAKLAALDERSAIREIGEARDIIGQRLNVAVNHFSYPYGAPGCCDAREFGLARAAGYTTAVTTRRGVLDEADIHGLTSLPRVPINGRYQSPAMIDALVSGLPMALIP